MTPQADVRKTYKLYIGGAFPRSESGHSYVVEDAKGKFLANAALGSRKDARDAVVAARAAFGGWSARTAYNRAQVVYRVAELMEDRRPQFVDASSRSEGLTSRQAAAALDAAIDRLVWYAGWADKLTQVVGNANPVAGPFFNLSTPEPTGVVAVLAPQESSLLGLISRGGAGDRQRQHRVVVSSYARPLPAVTFSEVLATSDVPGGVVNILTGDAAAVGPWLASHMDVNAIDLCGVAGRPTLATELEVAAADNLKRVRRARPPSPTGRLEPELSRDDRLPRDQDGLAPDRGLAEPTARATAARTCACGVLVSTATVIWVASSPSRCTTTLVWPTSLVGLDGAGHDVGRPASRPGRRARAAGAVEGLAEPGRSRVRSRTSTYPCSASRWQPRTVASAGSPVGVQPRVVNTSSGISSAQSASVVGSGSGASGRRRRRCSR